MVKALAVVVVVVAFGATARDAAATSCAYPPLRFAGGSYDFFGAAAGPALGERAGTAQYPFEAGGEDDCDVRYDAKPVYTIEGVPSSIAVAEEDGAIWVAGDRCAHPKGTSTVECLQEPLRFRGRSYHPVELANRKESGKLGPGRLDGRRVQVASYNGIPPRRMVAVVGRERTVFLAQDVCRVAWYGGLPACLRDPKVVTLGPLPETGRDWGRLGGVLGLGLAVVLAGGAAARRMW